MVANKSTYLFATQLRDTSVDSLACHGKPVDVLQHNLRALFWIC